MMLNLGCGNCFHSAWVNLDYASSSNEVISHDLTQGIPFPNEYFNACYSSHLLEHLDCQDAKKLLTDIFRILKPQGIIRVVVPDLESIVRIYLRIIEELESGSRVSEANYDWIILELYDQVARSFSGGQMKLYLENSNLQNKQFIQSRIGLEMENVLNKESVQNKSLWDKLKSKKISFILKTVRLVFAKHLVALIAGQKSKQAFEEGLFRHSGEIHRWMYDRFSLQRLLEEIGFSEVKVCSAYESRIPNFESYQLDVVNDKIRKPDSLFVEGIKL
jgi:predicted SAM-dependent methyltransferase